MKIGIILHPYGEEKPAGLGRAIYEWTKTLLAIDTQNEYVIFLKQKPKKLDLPGANWKIEVLGEGFFWLERLKQKTECDVYIFNTPVLPLFYKPKKSIVIALDFAYYYLAQNSIQTRIMMLPTFLYHKYSLKSADSIISISEATKKDIIHLFKISEEKIIVIPIGFTKICAIPEKKIPLPPKYFFFIGVHKKRKNILNIIKAYKEALPNLGDIKLVLAGNQKGAYFELLNQYVHENNLQKDVLFIGRLSDEELSYAYKHAHAFVFPSKIEGFGMPLLEAMDCEIPVITSNCSALSEVAGEAALLVPPHDIKAIKDALIQMTGEALQKELIQKGKERSKEFSWEKAAHTLLVHISPK